LEEFGLDRYGNGVLASTSFSCRAGDTLSE